MSWDAETQALMGPELCGREFYAREGGQLFIGTVKAIEFDEEYLGVHVAGLTVLTRDFKFVQHIPKSEYGGHCDYISVDEDGDGQIHINIPLIGSVCILPPGRKALAALKKDLED